MSVNLHDADTFAVLRALVSLSTLDWLYADQYLHRAEMLLPKLCTREEYVALRHDQEDVPRLTKELRQATAGGEWSKVRALAQQAAAARDSLIADSQIFAVAEAVYGPRFIHTDVTALALTGVVPQANAELDRTREVVLEQLRTLADRDTEWGAFYRGRVAHFEGSQVTNGDGPGGVVDSAELRKRILEAVDAGDFARVKQVADTVAAESGGSSARLHVPRPTVDRVKNLALAFPEGAVSRARELGLAMETLQSVGDLNAYLSCACADRATFPDQPRTATRREAESCTCGHTCPPDVRPSLRENLDFLMVHPFVTSAGTRYLPWFGTETVLVETFAETEPDAGTGLLGALRLPRRQDISRSLVEDALLTHGPHVCASLGLDPLEHVVACIPFDAYVRLAPQYGWGGQEAWTHLDGYQVTRDLHLWPLVGGNARYGGPDDLSSVPRDYDSERLTARFAVLRRERFLVRETRGT